MRRRLIDDARGLAAFIDPNDAKPFSGNLRQNRRAMLQRKDRIDSRILNTTDASQRFVVLAASNAEVSN